ncbi:hypothetical protein EYF80_017189 [Liparis tanakae]|uniref:Uncharacterized protein n=1 Tax=Liparis tanakae TaxID=230148 RepID=A0A4Z2I5N3_9TELE|nr:hypothetical protein EYF80_017189 [Liparis tanakae]
MATGHWEPETGKGETATGHWELEPDEIAMGYWEPESGKGGTATGQSSVGQVGQGMTGMAVEHRELPPGGKGTE